MKNGRASLHLCRELVERVPRVSTDPGPTPSYLSDAERQVSLAATLRRRDGRQPIWIFGYGSLMWNPGFPHAEQRVGVVHGYHRRFCLWVKRFRGTPERPGLMLGLEPGGCCRGIAYRLAPHETDAALAAIWAREMITAAYAPRWVRVRSAGGHVRAIAFAINRGHERYTGLLDEEAMVDALATAAGHRGSCAEYLLETVLHLEEFGIRDRNLWRLQALVAGRLAGAASTRRSSGRARGSNRNG